MPATNRCLCGAKPNKTRDSESIYCSTTCARADALAALTAPEDLTYTRASHYRRVSSKQELHTKAKEAALAEAEAGNDDNSAKSQKSASRQSHWKKARQILFGSPGSSDESGVDDRKVKNRALRRKSKSYSILNPYRQAKSPPKPPQLGQPKLKLKPVTRNKTASSDEELIPPPLPPKPARVPLGARHKRVPAIIKIPGRDVDFAHSRNDSTASEAQTTASSATTTTTFQTDTTATTAPSSIVLDTPLISPKKVGVTQQQQQRDSLASRITNQQSYSPPKSHHSPQSSQSKSPESTPLATKTPTPTLPAISFNDADSSHSLVRSPSSSNTVALNRARSKAMRDRQKRLSLAKSSNNLLQVASNQSLTKTLQQSQSFSTFKSTTTSTSKQTFESAFDGTNPADYSPSPTWEYDDIYNSNSNLRGGIAENEDENEVENVADEASKENVNEATPTQPPHDSPPLVDYDLNWFIQHSTSYRSIKIAPRSKTPVPPHSTPLADKDATITKKKMSSTNLYAEQNELDDLDDSMKQALLMADDILAFS